MQIELSLDAEKIKWDWVPNQWMKEILNKSDHIRMSQHRSSTDIKWSFRMSLISLMVKWSIGWSRHRMTNAQRGGIGRWRKMDDSNITISLHHLYYSISNIFAEIIRLIHLELEETHENKSPKLTLIAHHIKTTVAWK